MRKALIEFKFLTPALLAGADQKLAEMRIPSIRGALRYWARRLFDPETEREFFGSVEKPAFRSPLILRDLTKNPFSMVPAQNAKQISGSEFDYFLWPLRNDNLRGVIREGSSFRIECMVREGGPDFDERILKAFLLFGSLGTRSRRAYGSVWPVNVTIDDKPWRIPRTLAEFQKEADELFGLRGYAVLMQLTKGERDYRSAIRRCADFLKIFRCGKQMNGGPSPSDWGKNDHNAGAEEESGVSVYRAALGLPYNQRFSSGKTVSYTVEGYDRLASPLHFKVVYLDNMFVPILTVLNDEVPEDGTVLHAKSQLKNSSKNKTFEVSLDWELLDTMFDCTSDTFRRYWKSASEIGYWGDPEEE